MICAAIQGPLVASFSLPLKTLSCCGCALRYHTLECKYPTADSTPNPLTLAIVDDSRHQRLPAAVARSLTSTPVTQPATLRHRPEEPMPQQNVVWLGTDDRSSAAVDASDAQTS